VLEIQRQNPSIELGVVISQWNIICPACMRTWVQSPAIEKKKEEEKEERKCIRCLL
jgi:hypothetical protein